MNKKITKSQRTRLQNDIKIKKDDDKYVMTMNDKIIEILLLLGTGIRQNGAYVTELLNILGIDEGDFKQACYFRIQLCQCISSLVSEGYPVGGLKDGRLKKYGWTTEKEFEELSFDRIKRLSSETQSALKYLNEENKLSLMGKKLLIEIDNQLKLFE